MEQREQNDNKHSERKQHINAVIKRSDAMRKTERDIRSAYEEFMEKGDEETRKVLHETIMVFCNAKVRRLAHKAGGKVLLTKAARLCWKDLTSIGRRTNILKI